MTQIEHVNFGWLHKPPLPPASCHCLMVRTGPSVILIDTGIGIHDIAEPERRIGTDAIDAAGFKFLPHVTAIRQLEARGIDSRYVTDIVLTHCDSDHVGGLADFPEARVHVAREEKDNLDSGNPRYTPQQFSHGPRWQTYATDDIETFGLPSRKVATAAEADIRLVPLFGHTLGHCGVAVHNAGQWILHVGDAYYLRDELTNDHHPVSELATARADDDKLRKKSLETLRRITKLNATDLTYFGYHDIQELPEGIPALDDLPSSLG